jgi:tetratricopeptide (TPR) repeat protein
MVHLQAGFWQEAIACFEQVARDYPDSPAVQRALEEARFKAGLDAAARVRPKRWAIRWRPILMRSLIVVVLALLAWLAVRLIRGPVNEAIADARAEQQINQKRDDCNSFLEARRWDEAQACYEELLSLVPGDGEAPERLDQIAEEQAIEISTRLPCNKRGPLTARWSGSPGSGPRPGTMDVSQRIEAISYRKRKAGREGKPMRPASNRGQPVIWALDVITSAVETACLYGYTCARGAG